MEEALTALLASVADGRRFWVRAPASADFPFVVMNRVDGIRDYHMQGASGHVASRVQVDVFAKTYASAKTVARDVVSALSGFSGTQSGAAIQGIFVDGERDTPDADAGEVNHLFRTTLDIFVHHGEST